MVAICLQSQAVSNGVPFERLVSLRQYSGFVDNNFTKGDPENVQALQLGWARYNLIQAAISS